MKWNQNWNACIAGIVATLLPHIAAIYCCLTKERQLCSCTCAVCPIITLLSFAMLERIWEAVCILISKGPAVIFQFFRVRRGGVCEPCRERWVVVGRGGTPAPPWGTGACSFAFSSAPDPSAFQHSPGIMWCRSSPPHTHTTHTPHTHTFSLTNFCLKNEESLLWSGAQKICWNETRSPAPLESRKHLTKHIFFFFYLQVATGVPSRQRKCMQGTTTALHF